MRVCDFCRKPINKDDMKTLSVYERAKMDFSPCEVVRNFRKVLDDALTGRKTDLEERYELKIKEVCPACWKKYNDLVIKELLPKMEDKTNG